MSQPPEQPSNAHPTPGASARRRNQSPADSTGRAQFQPPPPSNIVGAPGPSQHTPAGSHITPNFGPNADPRLPYEYGGPTSGGHTPNEVYDHPSGLHSVQSQQQFRAPQSFPHQQPQMLMPISVLQQQMENQAQQQQRVSGSQQPTGAGGSYTQWSDIAEGALVQQQQQFDEHVLPPGQYSSQQQQNAIMAAQQQQFFQQLGHQWAEMPAAADPTALPSSIWPSQFLMGVYLPSSVAGYGQFQSSATSTSAPQHSQDYTEQQVVALIRSRDVEIRELKRRLGQQPHPVAPPPTENLDSVPVLLTMKVFPANITASGVCYGLKEWEGKYGIKFIKPKMVKRWETPLWKFTGEIIARMPANAVQQINSACSDAESTFKYSPVTEAFVNDMFFKAGIEYKFDPIDTADSMEQ